MRSLKVILSVFALLSVSFTVRAQEPLYRNEKAPVEERVKDLLSRMTVDEKIDLLRATSLMGARRSGHVGFLHVDARATPPRRPDP